MAWSYVDYDGQALGTSISSLPWSWTRNSHNLLVWLSRVTFFCIILYFSQWLVNICFVHILSHFCLFYFTTVFPLLQLCSPLSPAQDLKFLLPLFIFILLLLLIPSSYSSYNSSFSYSSSSSSLPSSSPQVLSTGPGSVPLLLDHSTWYHTSLVMKMLMILLVMMTMRLMMMKGTLQKATVPTMSRVTAARSCHCKLQIWWWWPWWQWRWWQFYGDDNSGRYIPAVS